MNKSARCRCCLSRPPDKHEGIRRLYGAMLKECFDIHFRVGVVSGDAGICNVCVKRLKDAVDFKAQVLQCQSEFEAFINTLKDEKPKIKIEIAEVIDDANFNIELKPEPVDMSDEDDRTLLSIKRETDSCANRELTARPLKPAPGKIAPVVARAGDTRQKPQRTQRDKILVAANMSESERLQVDAGLLFKHSNATPFLTKSLKGVSCLFCRETLPTMAALREHTHNKHEDDKVPFANHRNKLYFKMDILDLQCNLCHTDFDLISTLKKHLTEQHNIQFRSIKNYILEFKITDAEIMKCARCDATFETFKMLQQHMSIHYKNYVCEVCAIAFINTVLLKAHMKIHESGPHKKCPKCDKVFDNAARLYVHTKMHRKTDIKCPHCEETFKNYSQRNSHMLEQHKVPVASYKCNVCERTFTMKYGLNQHIKNIHLMQRDHICPVCEKGFYNMQNLRRHMVAHGGDRVHRCAVCQKAFARRKTLREHMRIHNNDRRFQCGVCGLKFVQKCSLKGHMMSTHGGFD